MFLFVFAHKQGIFIINLKVIVASIKGIKQNDLVICFCAKKLALSQVAKGWYRFLINKTSFRHQQGTTVDWVEILSKGVFLGFFLTASYPSFEVSIIASLLFRTHFVSSWVTMTRFQNPWQLSLGVMTYKFFEYIKF